MSSTILAKYSARARARQAWASGPHPAHGACDSLFHLQPRKRIYDLRDLRRGPAELSATSAFLYRAIERAFGAIAGVDRDAGSSFLDCIHGLLPSYRRDARQPQAA